VAAKNSNQSIYKRKGSDMDHLGLGKEEERRGSMSRFLRWGRERDTPNQRRSERREKKVAVTVETLKNETGGGGGALARMKLKEEGGNEGGRHN